MLILCTFFVKDIFCSSWCCNLYSVIALYNNSLLMRWYITKKNFTIINNVKRIAKTEKMELRYFRVYRIYQKVLASQLPPKCVLSIMWIFSPHTTISASLFIIHINFSPYSSPSSPSRGVNKQSPSVWLFDLSPGFSACPRKIFTL